MLYDDDDDDDDADPNQSHYKRSATSTALIVFIAVLCAYFRCNLSYCLFISCCVNFILCLCLIAVSYCILSIHTLFMCMYHVSWD